MDWSKLAGVRIHIVGIKGSGCVALAEILHKLGAVVTGSDTPEEFYTSKILNDLSITVYTDFMPEHIQKDMALVVYSAAYPTTNPELSKAAELGISCMSYPEALGQLSSQCFAVAVAGVHGKTTTAAMLGLLVKDLGWPATVLVGSRVAGFGDRATYVSHNNNTSPATDLFIAETCEYREHFMHFHPKAIILTAIEWDHQDYYPSPQSIEDAFLNFIKKLPTQGILLYNEACPGSVRVVMRASQERKDIQYYAFGRSAAHLQFAISREAVANALNSFYLKGFLRRIDLQVAGKHNVNNATSALAMALLLSQRLGHAFSEERALATLHQYRGLSRRLEIIGEDAKHNILVLDDYAHHPTAISTTLAGLRSFYPHRRIVLSFMSHTYSRTAALFDEFAHALASADILIVHKIYASAREQVNPDVTGFALATAARRNKRVNVHYVDTPLDALSLVKSLLLEDDIFITMGAGDNFQLSHQLVHDWNLVAE
jgi:UDP-N-acetylmuramate--alanine ligase